MLVGMSTDAPAALAPAAASTRRFPPQIRYIIGNEGCERFSFYGMKNTLTFFLINYLLVAVPSPRKRE